MDCGHVGIVPTQDSIIYLFCAQSSVVFPESQARLGADEDLKPQMLPFPLLSIFSCRLRSNSSFLQVFLCSHPQNTHTHMHGSIVSFKDCFLSSTPSWCALQMHQPGVSGCFLFHVRVIPTGPRPNESFPLRYGEKITFRVQSKCFDTAQSSHALCSLWWSQFVTHVCTHTGHHSEMADVVFFILQAAFSNPRSRKIDHNGFKRASALCLADPSSV